MAPLTSGPPRHHGGGRDRGDVFLQDVRDGIPRLFELIANPGIEIRESFLPRQLRAASALMERYADTPMDFADATLVLPAEERETDRVVTLDEP